MTELLVGTKKGLMVLRGSAGRPLKIAGRAFAGETVEFATRDRRSGRYFAAVTHGQFGPHLFYADDPTKEWKQAEGPAFPAAANAAVERIWVVEPGVGDGVLWCGVAPAALFRSSDGGKSWALVEGLWNVPDRGKWEPGAGGLCLHSICAWPWAFPRPAFGSPRTRAEAGGAALVAWCRAICPRRRARTRTLTVCTTCTARRANRTRSTCSSTAVSTARTMAEKAGTTSAAIVDCHRILVSRLWSIPTTPIAPTSSRSRPMPIE